MIQQEGSFIKYENLMKMTCILQFYLNVYGLFNNSHQSRLRFVIDIFLLFTLFMSLSDLTFLTPLPPLPLSSFDIKFPLFSQNRNNPQDN